LAQAAHLQADSLAGAKVQGTAGEALLDGALSLVAPEFGAAAPVVVPLLKRGVLSAAEIPPSTPGIGVEVARDLSVWAMDQVRQGTDEGKVLAPYIAQFGFPDPSSDRSNNPAVQDGMSLAMTISNSADLNKLIDDNELVKNTLNKIQSQLATQNNMLAVQAPSIPQGSRGPLNTTGPSATDLAATAFFRNASDGLTTFSYVLTLTSHAQEAEMIDKLARASKAIELLQTAQNMSYLAAANVYLYAATMIVSAIQISHQPASPFPAIFAMLQEISKQIEDLRAELTIRLNQIDTKLTAFISQSLVLDQATLQNVVTLNEIVGRLQQEVASLRETVQKDFWTIEDILFAEEDRRCFQQAGSGQFLPLDQAQFIECRNAYRDRGTVFARGLLAHAPTPSAAAIAVTLDKSAIFLPYASRYEALREFVDQNSSEYTQELAHPGVWTESALLFASLAQSQPQHFADLGSGQNSDGSPKLESNGLVIAGRDLQRFRNTLLLTPDDRKLRADRLKLFLDKLLLLQQESLSKITAQTASPGSTLDPTGGTAQPYNADYPFHLLAQPIPFCSGVAPSFSSYVQLVEAISGGAHGSSHLRESSKPPPPYQPVGIQGAIMYFQYGAPPSQYVAMLNNDFRNITAQELTWNKSILSSIDKALLLLEQSGYKKATLDTCITKFNLRDFNQEMGGPFTATLDVGLRIFLTFEEPAGRTAPLRVQELAGSLSFHGTEGGGVIYDRAPRVHAFFTHNWPSAYAQIPSVLKDVPDEETLKNRELANSLLNVYLSSKQSEVWIPLASSLIQEENEFSELRDNLEAALNIGLNPTSVDAASFLDAVRSAYQGLSPTELADSVVHGGTPLALLANGTQGGHDRLTAALQGLATSPNLTPPPDVLSAPLKQLEELYWLSALPTAQQ
jgi:hypothetical protein